MRVPAAHGHVTMQAPRAVDTANDSLRTCRSVKPDGAGDGRHADVGLAYGRCMQMQSLQQQETLRQQPGVARISIEITVSIEARPSAMHRQAHAVMQGSGPPR